MSDKPEPKRRRNRRIAVAIGLLYALVALAVLFWPTAITTGFRDHLDALGAIIPYGDKLLEVGANVLLFLPAGWLAGTLLPRGRRWLGLLGGVMVSTGVELAQAVLLPGRVASPRDVLANSFGVGLGILLAVVVERHHIRRGDIEPPQPAEPWPLWGRVAAWSGAAVLVALLGLGAWVGLDALRARDALTAVANEVPRLMDDARDDPSAVAAGVRQIEADAGRALSATTGVHWTIVGWLPWVGDNTRALQTVATSIHSLASQGLPALATVMETVTPQRLAPTDGRIDTGPLVEVRDLVIAGDTAVADAHEQMAAIDRTPLIPQLGEAVDRLTGELARAHELTSSGAAAVALLPPLLGADGPRDWLVLAQNNAELRATGGIPGAALLIRADDGRLKIADQRSSGSFGPYPEPVLPLTEAEQSLFGPELGQFIQDVNLTPDFPRSAELATTMWQRETGTSPSNVLSLDPVALANLLVATGPVEFDDPFGEPVTLRAEDAASFLMSGIYVRYQRGEVQDVVFALAAQALMKQLMSSDTDVGALLDAVLNSMAQHRLLLWSANPDEQLLLERIGASGALRGSVDTSLGTAPELGAFLNLSTASKTGYYLDIAGDLSDPEPLPDWGQRYQLRLRLTSLLQPGEAETLPEHVKWGNRDGIIRVNVLAYGPHQGTISPSTDEWPGFTSDHDGLPVSAQTVKVPAAQTVELTWQVTVSAEQPAPPVLRVTPGARNP